MESSSTPYNLQFSNESGNIPIKLPTPQDGSNILPVLSPIFSNALYIDLITTGGV